MLKKSATYGEYLILQDQSGSIKVLCQFDNVKASLRQIAKEVVVVRFWHRLANKLR